MRLIVATLCACILLAAAVGSAFGDWSNLLTNGSFATGLSGWNAYGAVTWDQWRGQPRGSAVVPEYAWGLLTQVVKVADDDWNPSLNKLEYEL